MLNDIYILLPMVQLVISVLLISVVLLSAPRDRLNRLFTAFLVALGTWGLTIFLMRDAFPDHDRAYAIEKIALAAIPFTSIFFYHFTYAFAGLKRNRSVLISFYALGIGAAVLSLLGITASGMETKFYGFAPAITPYFGFVLLASYPPVALAIYDIGRALRDAGMRRQTQLRLLRLGAIISLLGATSDFIPSLGLDIYPMGVLGNIGFGVIATFALTRYQLMELRMVARKGLAYTAISTITLGIYGIAVGILLLVLPNLSFSAAVLAAISTIFITGLFIQPLLQRVQTVVDRLFFRERFDMLNALAQLNSHLRDITDFNAVVSSLGENVRKILRTDWVGVALPDSLEQIFEVYYDTRGRTGRLNIELDGLFARRLRTANAPLFRSDMATDPYLQATSELERSTIHDLQAEMIVPLKAGGELTGFLYVGPKLLGGHYTTAELDFVSAATDQSAMAINNARAYAVEAQRREELERLDNLKSILLQTVSHELKSPITAIKLSTELLDHVLSGNASEEQRSRLVRTLQNGIQRLERLTSESLDYAAMQSAHLELNREPVRLHSVVRQAVALLQPSITAREQIVELDIDDSLHPLMIDEPRIERVIANLVSNAHKYSQRGGLIRIEVLRAGEDQVVRVIDQGPGIAEDEIDAVFSPYYRGKLADTSPVQGSGLGLSIARYLTELHDGTLTVSPQTAGAPAGGSTFVLKLPSSSFDLIDSEGDVDQAGVTAADSESLWPQIVSPASDTALSR
ncbi:MAG: ATP-binding protein [Chloroflexi bacterium]|nr:ATP-binding protein [Chloroflexota bacterium]